MNLKQNSMEMKRVSVGIPADLKGLGFLTHLRKDPLNGFIKISQKHGPYVWFEILGKPVLLLNDATAIQHIFQDNFENYKKADFNDVLKPLLGNGIFLTEGQAWKKQRRESAPVFANKNFPGFVEEITHAAESMFARWDALIAQKKPIKLDVEMMWFTLDVVLRALFHEEREDVAAKVKESLGLLLEDAEKRIWALASIPQSLTLKMPKYREALGFLDTLVADLVSLRKKNGAYPEDLLSRLIDAYSSSKLDQQILKDQVMSFLLAGHETTANGLTWAWYEISRRPEIRERLTKEVHEVLGNRKPTMADLEKLNYTAAIFEEAMRLYPPVWTMSRQALEKDAIPTDDGHFIDVPKDATMMLCAYSCHRSERYWDDPEAFDPERFLPENKSKRPKFSYFPFGGGPRLCLGHRFAMIESILAMAMIIQRYDLTLLPGQPIKPEPIITLRPDRSLHFSARRRVLFQLESVESQTPELYSDVEGFNVQCPHKKL